MFGTEPCSRVFHTRRPRAPALGVAWSFSFLPPLSFGGILLRGLRVRDRPLSSYSTHGTKRVKKTSKEWSLNQNPTPPEAAFPIPLTTPTISIFSIANHSKFTIYSKIKRFTISQLREKSFYFTTNTLDKRRKKCLNEL